MKKGILIGAALALSSLSSIACDINGTTGFMPKNNLWISTSDKATNGMTEQRFNEIIESVEAVYKPIVEAKGKKFEVVRNLTLVSQILDAICSLLKTSIECQISFSIE